MILLDETVDPFEYVLSVNLRRRHLTPEQRRELIAKLLKATPSKSDRQIAKTVKVSPTTVGTVRAAMGATGDVSKLDKREDSKGRHQPARKAERPKRTPQEQRAAIDGAVEGIQRGIVTGAKMSPHAERGLDCYETAPATVRALLDVESLSGTIWEPACGPGSIVTTLRAAGHHVVATDIESYACPTR